MADFDHLLKTLAERIPDQISLLQTEEATKNALIMPFIQALGYNVFDPREVIPEYTADIRGGNSEKVDYAILQGGLPIMIFECKSADVSLNDRHRGQLHSYFAAQMHFAPDKRARIGILTNGYVYEFYTDIDAENVMDKTPFWVVDFREGLDDDKIDKLSYLSKDSFEVEYVKTAAEELKYVNEMKVELRTQLQGPGDDLVRILSPANARLNKFKPYAKRAIDEFFREYRESMVSSAPNFPGTDGIESVQSIVQEQTEQREGVVTTQEEIEAFETVKSILKDTIDGSRLSINDTQQYCSIIVDNKRRNYTICQFDFKETVKYLVTFDNERKTERNRLNSLSDINEYAEVLRERALSLA